MANDWRAIVEKVISLQSGEKTEPGPSLQWYPDQWFGDPAVQLMNMEAQGIHIHLLMVAWNGFDIDDAAVPCSLPDDPEMLKELCGHPPGWAESWPEARRGWRSLHDRLWNIGLCRSYLSQMDTGGAQNG